MRISAAAPAGWNRRIASSVLSVEFGEAMTTLGWRPLYAWDTSDLALVLVRRLGVPGLRAWTTRAKVYVNDGYPTFVRELELVLAEEGVASAAVGDPVWPLAPHLRAGLRHVVMQTHHRIVHDVRQDDEALLARMHPELRGHLRRGARAEVDVREASTAADIGAFCGLGAETADRLRGRHPMAGLPERWFRAVFDTMVPRGQAIFLIARAGGTPLSGALFFRSGATLTYYHGVSTRDPALTPCQGPSSMFWHAMRLARALGLRYFDHGAVRVTDDPAHPHDPVYDYKRRFGGHVEEIASGRLVLSPAKHAFQERLMMPVWKRLYPLYLRLGRAHAIPLRA
ncbi:MAG: GNAT family N-acetyltransferase [Candidatus Rokubacteria bacterium]|nr:GNAT family N-acetyltransferase [Candidatus Rokubacteria bacterium]